MVLNFANQHDICMVNYDFFSLEKMYLEKVSKLEQELKVMLNANCLFSCVSLEITLHTVTPDISAKSFSQSCIECNPGLAVVISVKDSI